MKEDKAVEKKDEQQEAKEQDTNLIENKYEVAVKLQDLQADPNSPLFSVKSFEELGLYLPTSYSAWKLMKGMRIY